MLPQAQQLPPQLASLRISYKDFKVMAALRSSIYSLSFALDFCTQVRRDAPQLAQVACTMPVSLA
jgi:hypothetical protein